MTLALRDARPAGAGGPAPVRSVRRPTRPSWWTVLLVVLAAVVLAPVAALVSSALVPEREVWSHLWATRLPGMLGATVVLVALVTGGAAALGTGLAWLVAAHRFRGRAALVWLLAMPLAVPAYVSGFVALDTFGRGGAVHGWWTGVAGPGAPYLEVRSLVGAAVVMVLALYPYVYLLALGAFRDQSPSSVDAARLLGCTPWSAFTRVALPIARPAIIAGSVLVALEVLTDVGTVRLYNVQTLADGVFRVWFGLGEREGATELAGLLLLAAAAILLAERRSSAAAPGSRTAARPASGDAGAVHGSAGSWLGPAVVAAWAVVAAALVLPVSRLVLWTVESVQRGRTASAAGGLGHHVWSTLQVAAVTVVVCVVAGLGVAMAGRWVRARRHRVLATATTLGYGLPGPVVALGVLVCLAAVDRTGVLPRGTVLVGSFVGLVAALVVRYLALAVTPAQDALARVSSSVEDAARGLGASPARLMCRVQLPLARQGLLIATALVALDVLKELPATLLLRPFGIDTLPVWVWQASSDSRWPEAGLPSLVLVALAAVPAALLVSLMLRGRQVRW